MNRHLSSAKDLVENYITNKCEKSTLKNLDLILNWHKFVSKPISDNSIPHKITGKKEKTLHIIVSNDSIALILQHQTTEIKDEINLHRNSSQKIDKIKISKHQNISPPTQNTKTNDSLQKMSEFIIKKRQENINHPQSVQTQSQKIFDPAKADHLKDSISTIENDDLKDILTKLSTYYYS